MPEIPQGFAPGRYTGPGAGLREGMRYHNVDGTPRKDTENKSALSLETGDELLWRDEDVYGKTLWHDPNQNLPSKYVSLGHRAMKDDEGKTERELIDMGYEFHLGRPDVEPIIPLEQFLSQRKKQEPREVPQTITLEPEKATAEPEDIPATESGRKKVSK